jgi:hypothetical protein
MQMDKESNFESKASKVEFSTNWKSIHWLFGDFDSLITKLLASWC